MNANKEGLRLHNMQKFMNRAERYMTIYIAHVEKISIEKVTGKYQVLGPIYGLYDVTITDNDKSYSLPYSAIDLDENEFYEWLKEVPTTNE